ncbi:MAG: VOC family protein [Bryobacteraceae bacterium]
MSSSVIPCLRYRDAPAAIEWLCRVIGFEKHLVVPGPDDTIRHAQLRLNDGMIMVGSVGESEFDRLMTMPAPGETQCPYVVVADADEVHRRAREAGWPIEIEIADQDHGGRLFTCRDPEGHVWNIGTYDPWA